LSASAWNDDLKSKDDSQAAWNTPDQNRNHHPEFGPQSTEIRDTKVCFAICGLILPNIAFFP
jgi:hypothetical protein